MRLIETDTAADSYRKMAVDEALLITAKKTKEPVLRFYRWKEPAVAIGYFQELEKEVDTTYCKKKHIEIFRRITGGGAVYKDPYGEINYSLIIPENHPLLPSDVIASFQKVCDAIIYGLAKFGIETAFRPINDIVAFHKGHEKKISGNAQTRKEGVLLQHGTVLLDADIEEMFTVLKVPDEKIRRKKIAAAQERVITAKEILGKMPSKDKVEEAITEGFCEVFRAAITKSALTGEERALADKLYEKYKDPAFINWK